MNSNQFQYNQGGLAHFEYVAKVTTVCKVPTNHLITMLPYHSHFMFKKTLIESLLNQNYQ